MTFKLDRRELYYQAACALCRKDKQDPDELIDGKPRWLHHVPALEQVYRDCFTKQTIYRVFRKRD